MISVFRKTEGGEAVVCRLSGRNAKLTQECMGRDEVSVQVTVDEVLPLRELDFIRVDGGVYTLNRMTDYDEVSDVEFRYSLVFEGPVYNLMDKMFVDTVGDCDRFSLTGTLREFAGLLVANMNPVDAGWSVGSVPETERKSLTFESVSCREALNRLAGEFGAEYYLKGRQVCFAERFENHTSLVFERGKGKGLYKLTCRNADSGNTVTRVRVYGSTENLPAGYRDGQADRLLLPMSGGRPVPYLEDFSEFSKVVERTVHFDDVKPSFKGSVAAVAGEFNRRVSCPAIDFDLGAVAVGTSARVNFLTGELAGVGFGFEWDAARRELNLIRQEDRMALPDADGKRPLIPNEGKRAKAGDEFNFTGISLPPAYVERAERELLAKGQEWLSFYKQLRVNFGLDVDYRFLRESGYALHVGDVVTVKVPKLGMEKRLRVLSVEKDLDSGRLSCTVSNYLTESWEKRIEGQIQATQGSVERVNLNAGYLVEATREWVAQRFARLAGGNRFVGKQEVDGDVELAAGRKLGIGGAVLRVAKDVFRTVLSVAGKEGEDVDVESAGVKAKRVTAGEVSSPDFVSGFLGSGARLKDGHLELDELTVRKRMNVYELMVERVKSVGGTLIVSAGSAKVKSVEVLSDCFRCVCEDTGEGSPFVADDQVLCQTFGGGNIKRYWRRVVAVGEGCFDLSRTDCEAGSAVPEAGDEVVQLGHRSDRSRQSAILLCAVGADAPYTDHYDGVDGFTLAGKLVSRQGRLTGIADESFGQLDGAGLYARNAYLRGSLALSSGQTVDAAVGQVTEDIQVLMSAQDGFKVQVKEVREKAEAARSAVDGLQIGGVNLLDGCMTGNGWEYGFHEGTQFSLTSPQAYETCYIMSPYMEIGGSKEVVLSFEAKCDDNIESCEVCLLPELYHEYGLWVSHYAKSSDWRYHELRFVTPAGWGQGDHVVPVKLRVDHNGSTDGQDATLWVRNLQLECGNKATSWKLPVADQQAEAERVAQLKAEAERVKAEVYADGKVTAAELRVLQDAQAKYMAAVTEAGKRALGQSWAGGKMLYDDPAFKTGCNGVHLYNNAGNGCVTVTRVEKQADSPVTESGYNVEIRNTGGASPGVGGFCFETLTRAGAVLIARFIAKVPAGYAVGFSSNWMGDYAEHFFATSNLGTGKWEEYIYVVKCGSSGDFSSTMFFFLVGKPGTPESPVVWYLAYASVFDVTEGSNTASLAKEAAEAAAGRLSEWASDSKISPAEKTGLKQQLADVQAEYEVVSVQVERNGLAENSAWIACQTAYHLAVAALNKYTAVSPECIGVDADYSNIEAYYTKRNALMKVVSGVLSDNRLSTVIDATSLDQDRYYPVVCRLFDGIRSSISVSAVLYRSGIPDWATHPGGFVCEASWDVYGIGWGTIDPGRYVHGFSYNWANVLPIGSIGQMGRSSNEYIYVRGGGMYKVQATNASSISLKTEPFSLHEETVGVLDSVTQPEPKLEVVRTELDTKITAAEGKIALIASKEDFDKLGDGHTMMSQLTVAYDAIRLLAKDGNVGTGMVIDPKKIEITGETVFRNGSGDRINFFGTANEVFNVNNKFKVDRNGKATMADADITGKIVAITGKIGGFNVSGNSLTNNGANSDATVVFRNDGEGCFAAIGGNTLPSSTALRALLRLENKKYNPGSTNYGAIVDVSGATSNVALNVINGDILLHNGSIGKFGVKVMLLYNYYSIPDSEDYGYYINSSGKKIDVYLPPNPVAGRVIKITAMGSNSETGIVASGGKVWFNQHYTWVKIDSRSGGIAGVAECVYIGVYGGYKTWKVSFSQDTGISAGDH